MKDTIETVGIVVHKKYGKCILKEYDRNKDRCTLAIPSGYKVLKLSIVEKLGLLKADNDVAKEMFAVKKEEIDKDFKRIIHYKSGKTETYRNRETFNQVYELMETKIDKVDIIRG